MDFDGFLLICASGCGDAQRKEATTSASPWPYQGITTLLPLYNQGRTASTGTPFAAIALEGGGIPKGQVEPLLSSLMTAPHLGQLHPQSMSGLGYGKHTIIF